MKEATKEELSTTEITKEKELNDHSVLALTNNFMDQGEEINNANEKQENVKWPCPGRC